MEEGTNKTLKFGLLLFGKEVQIKRNYSWKICQKLCHSPQSQNHEDIFKKDQKTFHYKQQQIINAHQLFSLYSVL